MTNLEYRLQIVEIASESIKNRVAAQITSEPDVRLEDAFKKAVDDYSLWCGIMGFDLNLQTRIDQNESFAQAQVEQALRIETRLKAAYSASDSSAESDSSNENNSQ